MKFKKNFLIFTAAWAVFIMIGSDVLLISAYRNISTDVERSGSLLWEILVPTAAAAVCWALITLFTLGVIRRQRRRYNSIENQGQYAFFRNWVCVPAVVSILNTVFLYIRFKDVLGIVVKDEDRRLHMLYFDKPQVLSDLLSKLGSRQSLYLTAALVITVILSAAKAAAYLFSARSMVKCYHKNAVSAYGKSKEAKRK